MLEAASELGYHQQFILPVASSLAPEWVRQLVAHSKIPIAISRDARATLFHSRAAIVASGTATLEAALIGTPFVMVYRVTALTWAIGRRLVKLDRFAMPNLIAERDVVPEFVQGNFSAGAVAAKLRQLIADTAERQTMLAGLAEIRTKLHPNGAKTASERAAAAILETLKNGN